MRAVLLLLALSLLTCLSPGHVSAHGVDLQHFRPAVGAQGLYGMSAAQVLEPWIPTLGLTFSYAQADLRLGTDSDAAPLSEFQVLTFFQARMGVHRRLELGIDLPLALNQGGVPISGALDTALRTAGLGDLRFTPRLQLLERGTHPLELSLALPLTFPTGLEGDYLGEHGVTFHPQLQAGQLRQRLHWAASLGYRLRPPVDIYYVPADSSLELGNELSMGGLLELRVLGPAWLSAELEGRLGFLPGTLDDPLEARLGLRLQTLKGWTATAGGALGLTDGYGAAGFRAFVAVASAWDIAQKRRPDADRDGLSDAEDRCPKAAEDPDGFEDLDGCPDEDNDGDGVLDAADRCPGEPETRNGHEDDDGCPDILPDQDRDGIVDAADACPTDAEDKDAFQDQDGCPEPDNDGDGIVDTIDQCPDAPETRNGLQDEDGCPDGHPAPKDDLAWLFRDADQDGIPDATDKCPDQPELRNGILDDDGCPEGDEDGDGIVEGQDKCPNRPETRNGFQDDDGCPELDTDSDGLVDGLDKCPKRAETRNGFQDDDGCPEPDTDGDGLIDALDRCPKAPETVNALHDFDGCPEPDSDRDGIPDALDKCPLKPETANGFEDTDGCPEPDTDGDGIIDGLDRCPRAVETANGFEDGDGCPDQRPLLPIPTRAP